MAISENEVYPCTGDTQTVCLKNVITDPDIMIGDYTMYTIMYVIRGIFRRITCCITIR